MSPDYSLVDVGPGEWRRLLTPVGALWLALLGAGLSTRDRHWSDGWVDGGRAGAAAVVAVLVGWLAVSLVALAAGWAVERLWLHRWPRLGARPARRRRRRWTTLHHQTVAAIKAGDVATAGRSARRRNAIAVAPPQCPTWMADRWAALETRVHTAYGLDVGPAWPRLWLILPEPARAELRLAAAQWHRAAVWAAWAVLYAALAPLWWPALPVAAALGLWAWARARRSLADRADLIEAAFDTYGPRLAAVMRVPLPAPGRLTPETGTEITARFRKGA